MKDESYQLCIVHKMQIFNLNATSFKHRKHIIKLKHSSHHKAACSCIVLTTYYTLYRTNDLLFTNCYITIDTISIVMGRSDYSHAALFYMKTTVVCTMSRQLEEEKE